MPERTDGQLLADFAKTRSEEAFAKLVERHGRMVYGACLRVLGSEQNAEDAAQAAFAILARKARKIASRPDAGGWLHKVAVETARNLRKSELRRRAREKEAGEMIARGQRTAAEWERVSPHVDEALARLPAAQRDAVVAVYLEGRTRTEVAADMKLPEGTVASRSAAGLEKLRLLLSRSGVSLGAAALGSLLVENAASAALPASFSSLPATCAAFAAKGAAGAGGSNALLLAEGAMKAMTLIKIKIAAAVICAATVLGGGGTIAVQQLRAAEPAGPKTKKTERKGPLAKLPSKPGAHIAKIKALGDNSWVNLGQAAADPKWGVAHGRSWTPKMPYARDLGGAFFTGCGQHGFVKPDGHFMDDLWFYDANAHRWICLYPGGDSKTLKLKLDKNGFEVNEQGDFIPVSYLGHGYNNVAYNPDTRKFMLIYTYSAWWTKAFPQRMKWTGAKDAWGNGSKLNPNVMHPVFWNVDANKWERKKAKGTPKPRTSSPGNQFSTRYEGVFQYLPDFKKTMYTYKRQTTWFYDHATNTWSAGPQMPKSVGAYDSNGCYDSKRKRVYVARRKGFAYLDLVGNKWHEVKATGQPEDLAACNGAQLYFDSASGVVLWHQSHGPIVVYDPDANKWTDMGNTAPEIPTKRFRMKYMKWHGFYHEKLNAHFFYLAGDSRTTEASMLAYRYKRRDSKGTPTPKKAERKGPLKDLPSKPGGAHLAKIKALGDNAWVDLGTPTPDPKRGLAPGRSWASRMPFAPDLRGAFLYGEGVHGGVVNGHYMDDLWFYDLNQHRWVCVYPGMNAKNGYKGFTINKDGFETNLEGHPVPVASMVHAYNVVTYDTDRRKFMSLPNAQHYCWDRIKGRLEFLSANMKTFYSESHTPRLKKGQVRNRRKNKPSPWMYATENGHWQRYRCRATNAPSSHMGVLHYIPTRKMVLSSAGKSSAWYDPEKKDWIAIANKGEMPTWSRDFNVVYDSKRDRLYMGGGLAAPKKGLSALWMFDVKTETFTRLKPKGNPSTTVYTTNRAVMNYDSVNDVVVLFLHGPKEGDQKRGATRGIYVYHPGKNEWETVSTRPKELMPHIHHRNALNGFYDPTLNVHILHRAGDSRANGTMSAWRYKRAKK